MEHGAVNLAQGFPDFPAPEEVKRAAVEAIEADVNQYAITWGARGFREAIAQKFERTYGMSVDPERQICVTCGSTEAMIASMLGVIDPGDEVIVFEPFYENYGPDAILAGAVPHYVTLREPDWSFDDAELAAAFSNRTRAIIVNTPNNPTGKVFTRAELETIGGLASGGDDRRSPTRSTSTSRTRGPSTSRITVPGMEDRTILVNAMSKTYSVTGWRVGWTIASPALTEGVRKVHDFLTVGAAAPLQEAGVTALNLRPTTTRRRAEYLERRDFMLETLEGIGLPCSKPLGAYYVMTDITGLGYDDDVAAAEHLVSEIGVASVPGSSFYSRPELGRSRLRFSFCKRMETLHVAAERLQKLRADRTRSRMELDNMLRREEEAWRDFAGVIAAVPAERRSVEGVVPGWSPHDLLWHCAYWTEFAGGVLDKVRAGRRIPRAGSHRRRTSWRRAGERAGTRRSRAPRRAGSEPGRRCRRSTTRSPSWRPSGSARTPSSTTTSTLSRSARSISSVSFGGHSERPSRIFVLSLE